MLDLKKEPLILGISLKRVLQNERIRDLIAAIIAKEEEIKKCMEELKLILKEDTADSKC